MGKKSARRATSYHESAQPDNKQYLSSVSPKDQPWDRHRGEGDDMAALVASARIIPIKVGKQQARRLTCAELLDFEWSHDEAGEVGLRLQSANFCRVRTCPVCQWRRTLKHFARLMERLPVIMTEQKLIPLFLTLTVQNCSVEELRETIKHMNQSWRRLTQRDEFEVVRGWLKSVEVTRSDVGEAHPHFHVLLLVPSSYFGRGYVTQKRWTQLWQESARFGYKPMVHIRRVKDSGKNTLEYAVAELVKYSTKPQDLIDAKDAEWAVTYMQQVDRMRFVDGGGVLKGILSDDYEDLVHVDKEEDNEEDGSGDEGEKHDPKMVLFGWRRSHRRYVRRVEGAPSRQGG